MFQLGLNYADGLGVKQNLVQAYLWLERAALKEREQAAQERDLIEARMSEEELAEAKRLALDW
jgi:TPR repeat protein